MQGNRSSLREAHVTVKQLIKVLQKLPGSHNVVINKGSGEGSPLDSVGLGQLRSRFDMERLPIPSRGRQGPRGRKASGSPRSSQLKDTYAADDMS